MTFGLKSLITKLENENATLKMKQLEYVIEIKMLRAQSASHDAEIANLRENNRIFFDKNFMLQFTVDSLSAEIATLRESNRFFFDKNSKLQATVDSIRGINAGLMQQLAEAKATNESCLNERDELKDQLLQSATSIQDLLKLRDSNIQHLTHEMYKLKDELPDAICANRTIRALRKKLSLKRKEIDSMRDELENTITTLSTDQLKMRRETLKHVQEKESLKEELAFLREKSESVDQSEMQDFDTGVRIFEGKLDVLKTILGGLKNVCIDSRRRATPNSQSIKTRC